MSSRDSNGLQCPIPLGEYPRVLMAHGGGGRLMHQLLDHLFLSTFGPATSTPPHDAAVLDTQSDSIAFTTDSYVVQPLVFPGGDIGSLAVYGTVNDLAMAGAQPLYLSAGFILEEGLPMEMLWRIVLSMKHAADHAGVRIVTGDTKVVNKGKGDGIFISTAGVGRMPPGLEIHPGRVCPGDALLLSGDLGRHGITIMAAREGLRFETTLESDCAPVAAPVAALLEAGIEIHCLRDLTRGGLAAALVEIAQASQTQIEIQETALPVEEQVRGACEILGLDPLYVANEGRFAAFLPEREAARAVEILMRFPVSADARVIGRVGSEGSSSVVLETALGTHRVVDLPSGEQLPRIC